MCGINGIVHFNASEDYSDHIRSMCQSMAHRGPDAEGTYIKPGLGLGHRRLSIIDLSEAANQPMINADGRYTIVYNGELYNYQNIRSKLNDYPFKTNSDTETILAAYITWGSDCLQEFNGMFAFAIWDNERQEMFIARDRLGIKPLYFWSDDDKFVFASEVRSLLASGLVDRKLNKEVLNDYLRYQTVQGSDTMVEGVKMFPAGHYALVGKEGFSPPSQNSGRAGVFRFWDPIKSSRTVDTNDSKTLQKNIKELIFESVERRLVADVPFGAFLSGGIDSSAVVAAMSEVQSGPVSTFSVSFDEEAFSEEKYAQIVAKKFGTDHHNIRLTASDLLDDIPHALKAMDHPSGDGINTYTVSKATKNAGITMALSGLGGDEIFSGYPVFRQMESLHRLSFLKYLPRAARNGLGQLIELVKPGVAGRKIHDVLSTPHFTFDEIYPVSRQLYSERDLSSILNTDIQKNWVQERVYKILKEAENTLSLQSLVTLFESNSYLEPVLLRDTDQMSMAHALEVRVPFLDHTLVEYMLNVPDREKLKGFPKELLVMSFGDLLPPEVYQRKKMGFVFPWEHWLRNELRPLIEEKLSALEKYNSFNSSVIKEKWDSFLRKDPSVNWVMIWSLVVLSNWLEENQIHE